jgi:hypothetical protein
MLPHAPQQEDGTFKINGEVGITGILKLNRTRKILNIAGIFLLFLSENW